WFTNPNSQPPFSGGFLRCMLSGKDRGRGSAFRRQLTRATLQTSRPASSRWTQTDGSSRWARGNTVHLAKFMAFCMRQGQEATGVAYGCGTPSGCPDYGLHQSWRNNQNVSSVCYWASAGEDGNGQYSSARSSGAGGYLL